MGLRSWLGNVLIARGRKLGRSAGCELAVDLDEHTINAKMIDPNREDVAWDDDLYKHGNLFLNGYANPIKAVVHRNKELEEPDEVDVHESEKIDDEDEEVHRKLISSDRFAMFMRQHLVEQMVLPQQHWKLVIYGLIGLALIMVATLAVTLSNAGVF